MNTTPLEADLKALLKQLQHLIVKHPIAAQSAYSALVKEGRAFAQTEAGKNLRERLVRSEAIERLRSAWDIVSFGALSDTPQGTLPSALLEALARSAAETCFESRIFSALAERPPVAGSP